MSNETRGVVIVPKWTSAAWWNDLDCVTVTYWDLPPEFFFIKEKRTRRSEAVMGDASVCRGWFSGFER